MPIDGERRRSLESWLAGCLQSTADGGARDVRLESLRPAAAGQSNETLQLRVSWSDATGHRDEELILRCQPTGRPMSPDTDVRREYEVLAGLQATAVPSPRVWWLEEDPSVLGGPFFVMEQVDGRVPIAKPSIHASGWFSELLPYQRQRLWNSAMDALARIHGTPWERSHRFLADHRGGTDLAAHLRWLTEWYRWVAGDRSFPVTDAALAWLQDHRTAQSPTEPVLVWGDARPGNLVIDHELQVAAVIDWEFAAIGPREIDVAHWRVFDEFLTTMSGFDPLPGYPGPEVMRKEYEKRAGVVLGDLTYFEVCSALFLATTVLRQADLAVDAGRLAPNTTMGAANSFTQMLARRIGLPDHEASPDFLAHRRPKAS